MDVSALKSSVLDASKAKEQKAKGVASAVVTVAGLAQSFTEMVKAGFSIDRGTGAITDRFAFAKSDPTERPPAIRRDDPRNDSYDRRDDTGRDYPSTNAPRADDYRGDGGEPAQTGVGDRDTNAVDRDNSASGPGGDKSGGNDAPGKSGEQAAYNSTNSGGENDKGAKRTSGENSGVDSADAAAKNAAATGDAKTVRSSSAALKNPAGEIFAGRIAAAGNSSRPGQASEQAGAKTLDAGGSENAVSGLTKALAAASKQNRSNTGDGDQAGLKNQGRNGQANAKTNADAQSAVQAATDPAAKAPDAAARQAAGIAKAAGDDNKLAIQVAVENEANVLVSKPRSSLLSTTAKSADGNKSTAGHNGGQNGSQGPAQSGLVQAQNQGQNGLQQAAQVQTASGPNIKAPAQGTFNAGAQAASGAGGTSGASGAGGIGGENLPGAGTPAQADQGRQAGDAKSAVTRANLPPRAIVEQVTVQITKALSAGIDKINIQLRPETLGRVEVQLEMAKDGKAIAVVTADNKDTLDLLKQDSQNLEQSLRDAGLDLDSGDLSFNLRGEETGGEEAGGGAGGHEMAEGGDKTDGEVADTPYTGLYNDIIEEDRIDVRA